MARRPRLHVEGATYHVIARGNERRVLFRDDEDRTKYLALLRSSVEAGGAKVLAYCLMSNHVHLAVEVGEEPLGTVIKPAHAEFAQYFNRRHGRTGHLFEGRYRAILIDRDSYLLSVVRYIHLNPVKAGLASAPERYGWCSHAAYLGRGKAWVVTEPVLSSFRPRRDVRRRFHEFVTGKGDGDSPEYAPDDAGIGVVAGPESFRRAVLSDAGRPDLARRAVGLERIVKLVSDREGIGVGDLKGASRARGPSRVRAMCAVLARDLAGIAIAETARYFGRDDSTLWRNVAYLEGHLDEATKRRLAGARAALLK